ncbi:MAG: transposase [Anaerovoracaceae bacterium]
MSTEKRIIAFDKLSSTVTFSYKDNRDAGREKQMTITAFEFIRRFLLHVLPRRFMKIRHYGLLNNFNKFQRIKLCLKLLGVSALLPPTLPKFVPLC